MSEINKKSAPIKKLAVIAAILAIFFIASAVVWKGAIKNSTPLSYSEVCEIRKRDLCKWISCEGEVRAKKKTLISSGCNQKISSIYYKIGDYVNEGDLLVEFDRRELYSDLNKIRESQRILESYNSQNQDFYKDSLEDQHNLTNIKLEKMKSLIDNTTALYNSIVEKKNTYVQRAEEEHRKLDECMNEIKSETNEERLSVLYQKCEEIQKFYDLYSESIEKYTEIVDNYSDILKQYNDNYILQQEELNNKMASAQISYDSTFLPDIQLAQLASTAEELEKKIAACSVYSTISGYVTDIYISEGEMCSDGRLMNIENITSNYICLKVRNNQINNVYEGMEALISVSSSLEKNYSGVVTKIENYSETDYFNVYVEMEESCQISVGIAVNVRLITEKSEHSLCVPFDAVITDNSGSYVYEVVKSNTKNILKKNKVDVKFRTDYYFAIESDMLDEGSIVCCDAKNHSDGEYIDIKENFA